MPNYAKLNENAEKLARISLKIEAIKLNPKKPFTWASGYQMPIYNDNRMLLGNYDHRNFVASSFQDILLARDISADVIAGTSTAGISPATTLADMLQLPFIYVRDKPKGHGMKNRIEGIDANKDLEGKRVVLIEDLISMGGSSASAVDAIRKANGQIDYCLSIFSYKLNESEETFLGKRDYDNNGGRLDKMCGNVSILNFDTLLQVAKHDDAINAEELFLLAAWRKDPTEWGDKRGFPRVVKSS